MIYLGKKKPGSTFEVPFHTFAGAGSITMSGLSTAAIEIYKNGGTTQRSSDNGYTLLDTDGIDFDGATGLHGFSVNLSDNSDAGFYVNGSRYLIAVYALTVDGETVRFWAAYFDIGYDGSILDTTIATLSSQTSFTLTAGPAEANALLGCPAIIHDIASGVQFSPVYITGYAVTTRTVTLAAGATFTAAAGDNISVFMPTIQGTVKGRRLDISTGGAVGVDWANVESQSTSVNLSATTTNLVNTATTATTATNLTNAPTNGDLTATMKASVNTEVDSAIETYKLDHLVAAAESDDPVDNSIIAKMVASGATADWSTYVNTTDSQQAIRDHIGDGTNLTEAGGDGDHLTEAGGDGDHLTETGGTGDQLTAIPWNASWDAEVQSEVTDALEADGLDHLVSASVTGSDIADNSIIAKIVSKSATADWDDFVNTTDSLQALLDYIKNDTFSEVSAGAPTDTPTFTEMVRELYWAWKNKKTVTSSTITIRNSADDADLHTSTISDDSTTFTKGEFGA